MTVSDTRQNADTKAVCASLHARVALLTGLSLPQFMCSDSAVSPHRFSNPSPALFRLNFSTERLSFPYRLLVLFMQ